MNLTELEYFLNHNAIPKIKGRPKTFFSISKQPHYENVMSNIYAFYFNIEEVHGMQDLFIRSLLDLIDESNFGTYKKVGEITEFEVKTEVRTKRGRIDLLLSNDEYAIIIENKVYHTLNNNLEDYWNSICVIDSNEENKIGIVLSLNKVNVTHGHFINITHLEFLTRIIQNLGGFLMNARDKYVVFLKDFYQNIINLSKSEMDSKELKFYFDNQAKIVAVNNLHNSFLTHIVDQVEDACKFIGESLVLHTPKGNKGKRLRYLLSPRNKNLMFVLLFEGLLTTDKTFKLVVELKNDLLKNKEQYNSIDFTEEERTVLIPAFYTNRNSSWCHFASKEYTLTEVDVSNLTQWIVTKLEEDHLLSIYRKLNEVVKNQRFEKVLVEKSEFK